MKIALIVPGFSAHERDWCIPALLDYVRALAQRAEVHVYTLRWPEWGGQYTVFGASVHAMDGRRGLGVRVLALWARTWRAIAAEHRRAPFDVLHAFWADEPGWVATWAGRMLQVPVVVSLAGGECLKLPDIGYGHLLLRGREPLLRATLRSASAVTAGSTYLCDRAAGWMAARRLPRAVAFAPLGVDLQRFAPAPRPAAASLIVNVGSLTPVKDQALLLRAFRQLSRALPTAELAIAGEGPLRARLAEQADGLPVHWLGPVAHEALPAVYTHAAVLAQTSRHEAQGMAVLEAAATGVPAVGTPVGVLPEIGQVAASEDELAESWCELLRDETRRQSMAAAAREVVAARYELGTAVERFLQLYAGLARP